MRHTRHGMVPPGGVLVADDELCRLGRHQGLRRTEETERLGLRGRRTRIVAAQCTACGRHQKHVRVVYPPDQTIPVGTSMPRSALGDREGDR